jgi:hypothetical protein
MSRVLTVVLARAVSHKLVRVVASYYVPYEDAPIGAPDSLWLQFADRSLFRLFGAPDGWHLQVDTRDPCELDLGNSGRIVIRDLPKESPLHEAIGHTLERAWTVVSKPDGGIIGVRMDFGQQKRPIILNWGDELYVSDQYPKDAAADELEETPVLAQ